MEKIEPDPRILNYVKNGGELFWVKNIDTIRDGGNKIVKTDNGNFYIHRTTYDVHSGWPLTSENIITDTEFIYVLMERMKQYIERSHEALIRDRDTYKKLQDRHEY